MKDRPTASRSEFARLVPKAYGWLFEHDREWVEAFLPTPRPHIKSPSPIDWNQRDAEFAAEARATAERLKQAPWRPIRISKNLIAQELGVLPIIYIKALHLPLTNAVLEEVSEIPDDWAVRRIQWAKANSSCHFLENDRCTVHPVSPFGCRFFDHTQSKAEADAISMHGLVEIARAWQRGDLYARLWLMLQEAGRITPSPIEARARMRDAINTKM